MRDERIVRVDTQIDEKVFRDFSNFNAFVIGKRWLTLIGAAVILAVLSAVNWYTGGNVLAYICAALAVLSPIFYVIQYVVSLKGQIKKFHLEIPRRFYSVKISSRGVEVKNETEHVEFAWKQAYRVYEKEDYFYIFITKARGYILPKADIVSGTEDILRELIRNNLPEIRYKDNRRK